MNPVHLIFVVVLPHDMKSGGIEDAGRLFFYPNLVGNRADKVGSLAGLYKALGLKKRKSNP